MNIGSLRSRVTFRKETVTVDRIGNRNVTWEDLYTCSASVNLQTAGEHTEAGQTVANDVLVFTVRYCDRLSALCSDKNRILFNGHLYDICSVDDPQFRHETLKLTAKRTAR